MPRRDRIDLPGTVVLLAITVMFAMNQVLIKLANAGFDPLFGAALRSILAAVVVLGWMRLRGIPVVVAPGTAGLGVLMGIAFTVEFMCIFLALDISSVTRTTVLIYTMPIWFALAAHVLLPGERITGVRLAGLVLAFGGLVLAIADEGSATAENPLLGDALAIGGALGWAAVALLARRGGQRGVGPEMQLLWMVTVSGVALLALSLTVGGPPVRAPDAVSVGALVFQATVVVAGAFLVWFWLLDLYPASTVTSFSFLTPILGVTLGWALLGDPVTLSLALGGALVVAGLVLVNRPARPGQVPQKVRSTR